MMFPLVLDLAADQIPIAVTCRVLGFSKRAFAICASAKQAVLSALTEPIRSQRRKKRAGLR